MRENVILMMSFFTLLSCASNGDPRQNVDDNLEMPAYQIVKQAGTFELRDYAPYIVASVTMEGNYDAASRDGFRILADYIFGANQSRTSIAMTAPVSSSPSYNEEIEMTAPVRTTAAGTDRWEISFSMPSKYTLETLPTPMNDQIRFTERPRELAAANVFAGFTTMSILQDQQDALAAWLETEGMSADGPFVVARYNDPFTLPWNRRNELIVKVVARH